MKPYMRIKVILSRKDIKEAIDKMKLQKICQHFCANPDSVFLFNVKNVQVVPAKVNQNNSERIFDERVKKQNIGVLPNQDKVKQGQINDSVEDQFANLIRQCYTDLTIRDKAVDLFPIDSFLEDVFKALETKDLHLPMRNILKMAEKFQDDALKRVIGQEMLEKLKFVQQGNNPFNQELKKIQKNEEIYINEEKDIINAPGHAFGIKQELMKRMLDQGLMRQYFKSYCSNQWEEFEWPHSIQDIIDAENEKPIEERSYDKFGMYMNSTDIEQINEEMIRIKEEQDVEMVDLGEELKLNPKKLVENSKKKKSTGKKGREQKQKIEEKLIGSLKRDAMKNFSIKNQEENSIDFDQMRQIEQMLRIQNEESFWSQKSKPEGKKNVVRCQAVGKKQGRKQGQKKF